MILVNGWTDKWTNSLARPDSKTNITEITITNTFYNTFKPYVILVPTGKAIFTDTEAVNSSCISLKWSHIPQDEVKGILRSYDIVYNIEGKIPTDTVSTGLVNVSLICGLEYYTSYNFKIYAKNDDWTGTQYSSVTVRTGEGSEYKCFTKS